MKKILIFVVCFLTVFLSACNGNTVSNQPQFDENAYEIGDESECVIKNEKYSLSFDETTAGVVLTELATGKTWSTSPQGNGEEELDELGMPIKKHSMVMSPLTVRYKGKSDKVDNEVFAYDGAVSDGRVVCKRVDNGIYVEYYFDEIKVMVPVTYTLYDGYVTVSVDTSKIQESDNIVTAITTAPFWCSVKNNSEASYLFVPSGSGALTGVDEASALGNRYSAQVYGEDESLEYWYDSTNHKNIKLPVYGAKFGDNAAFAIIEEGAESAEIESVSGASTFGYSTVYATFILRGNTRHLSQVYASETADTYVYDNVRIDGNLSVRLYPLTGEAAGYTGMAKIYREYLESECGLKRSDTQSKLNINFVGGTLIKKSFFGIPYETVLATTEIEDVTRIIEDLGIESDAVTVNLKGFGKSGTDIGELAGGFAINKNIGTAKELKALLEVCGKKSVKVYMDFDICRFSESSNGFSTFSDSIYSVTYQRKADYISDKAARDAVSDSRYYYLSPRLFTKAADKLIKKANKWKLEGISLSSLSSISYSDYKEKSDARYHSKLYFGNAVTETVSKIKSAGLGFMSADANAYAAVASDIIVSTPTESDGDYSFSCDVPFYQMVFGGYVPMSCESINLSESWEKSVLSAVESGCGLDYTVIAKWSNKLVNSDYTYFYSTLYDGIKDRIISDINSLADYYGKISGSAVKSHEIIKDGVRKTVFENGVTVYVNYNDFDETVSGKKLEALSFEVEEVSGQ